MDWKLDWDDPKRNHGDAKRDFAVIAEDVQARGLEKSGSSGDRQITGFPLRQRDHFPPSVYVGKRSRAGDHPPGEPWYVQWKDERTVRFTFSNPIDVICWLRLSGF